VTGEEREARVALNLINDGSCEMWMLSRARPSIVGDIRPAVRAKQGLLGPLLAKSPAGRSCMTCEVTVSRDTVPERTHDMCMRILNVNRADAGAGARGVIVTLPKSCFCSTGTDAHRVRADS
jgi:hypothetical protein